MKQNANTSEVEDLTLDNVPLYDSQIIDPSVKDCLEDLETLNDFKLKGYLTIATGAQESWPEVPESKDERIKACINELELEVGEPIFVLSQKDLRDLKANLARPLTEFENKRIRPFLKVIENPKGFEIPLQKNKILFMDKGSTSNLTDKDFKKMYPHINKWLLPFKKLLLCDIDREEGRRKWWMLHRSCDERPDAKIKCGIDFSKTKVVLSQFLSNDVIAVVDKKGHVTSNMSSTCIAPRNSTKKNKLPENLREDWVYALVGWLNSFLIRDVWYRALSKAKIRGPKGEINVSHVEQTPIVEALFLESSNESIEEKVKELISKVKEHSASVSMEGLNSIDLITCELLYEVRKDMLEVEEISLTREKYLDAIA